MLNWCIKKQKQLKKKENTKISQKCLLALLEVICVSMATCNFLNNDKDVYL